MITELILGCLKVFFCRILDVTLGSMRMVLVVREKTIKAACIGFFEVFIWYVIVRDAINFDGPVIPIAVAYAAGYAMGTFIGGSLAKKLIGGTVTLHVVTTHRDAAIPKAIRAAGYGITVIDVEGSEYGDKKYLILTEFDKNQVDEFEKLISRLDPNAFVIVQETKSHVGGFRQIGK